MINSRIWLEWAIPRDFKRWKSRLRSPLLSVLKSSSQVSMREETPMVAVSNSPEWVRLVNRTVICRFLKKSTRRMSTDFTSLWLATMDRLVMGSMITVAG